MEIPLLLQGAGVMIGAAIGVWLMLLIIAIIIAIWVYQDARNRYPPDSYAPILWVLIVLLIGIIGLIVYIIVRPKEEYKMQAQPS